MKHKVLCWNCKTETEAFEYRCNICKKIQNIGEVNPYDLFSLKKIFFIDYDELENKYFQLQNIFESIDVRQLVLNPRVEATPFLYSGNRSRNFFQIQISNEPHFNEAC